MSYDGVLIRHLVDELKQLETGRISKIQQISKLEVLLTIRANSHNHKLLISSSSEYARLHLTDHKYDSLTPPPNFCMVLRKHIDGGIISYINQYENDRVIIIGIIKINELGDRIENELIFEAMGKHSNLILVKDKKIIEAIKHIPPFLNTYRTILPGSLYSYPPQDKPNPYDGFENTDTFTDIMSYQGISPLLANEILLRNDRELIHSSKNPVIIRGGKDVFYFFPVSYEGEVEHFDTINEMLDAFYYNRDSFDRIRQRAKDLSKFIKNEYDKNVNKLDKLRHELTKASEADHLRIKGEILLANLHFIKKGMNTVKLENFYDGEEINIPLDPLKSPSQNANRYFNKYRKAKKAIDHLKEQIELTKDEIEYFELLIQQISQATQNDIDEIRQELEENKYLRRRLKKKIKKFNYSTYISNSGTEILVGRNNKQNEYITHKLAGKNDIWMHAKDIPGAHVIIKDSNPDEHTMRTAANLAAYFSKAQKSNSVPVDYTFAKFVKKIPKKKLSFVTYKNQKTIYIDPDESIIMHLKQK